MYEYEDVVKEKSATGLVVAIIIVVAASTGIFSYDAGVFDKDNEVREQLITPCEKELPRNEKCVLIAVPENSLKQEEE